MFFDNGLNTAEIDEVKFSFYEFTVTKHAIQKRNLYGGSNYPGEDIGVNRNISAIYLLNTQATDISPTPFACMLKEEQQPWEQPMPLNISYDYSINSVIITNATANASIDGFRMKTIFFGDLITDGDVASLCFPNDTNYQYKVVNAPSLQSDFTSIHLSVPGTLGKPDLLLNVSVLWDVNNG